ncbi:MAG: hypothetical protein Q8Q08_06015 [Candidatus Omnitrophota bacterium]|nr:hypothetical protein [Candidatus Omnitrophota bacterium]
MLAHRFFTLAGLGRISNGPETANVNPEFPDFLSKGVAVEAQDTCGGQLVSGGTLQGFLDQQLFHLVHDATVDFASATRLERRIDDIQIVNFIFFHCQKQLKKQLLCLLIDCGGYVLSPASKTPVLYFAPS